MQAYFLEKFMEEVDLIYLFIVGIRSLSFLHLTMLFSSLAIDKPQGKRIAFSIGYIY